MVKTDFIEYYEDTEYFVTSWNTLYSYIYVVINSSWMLAE
jgi:hypothetical protein